MSLIKVDTEAGAGAEAEAEVKAEGHLAPSRLARSVSWTITLIVMMLNVALITYFILIQSISSDTSEVEKHDATKAFPSISETSSSSLYKCELSYLQMDSNLIKFSINHLAMGGPQASMSSIVVDKTIVIKEENFVLDEIAFNATFEEMRVRTKLDPNLPFIFFINGFNTLNKYGEINGTWMLDVAKNLASHTRRRQLLRRSGTNEINPKPKLFYRLLNSLWPVKKSEQPQLRANMIFLTWGIPELLAGNILSMIPAYYKTVANYDLIMEFVEETVTKVVYFIEHSRLKDGWPSELERARYYSGFEFYGHSLGSHILTDAIQRVRKTAGLDVKFGKLTGLDPATPCFVSLEHGISASKVASAVNELVVVHSNAGLAGLTSERANIEIVLNGGTFQPGCPWYDFGCHHSRSTDILRYRDDQCQMVAYKCTSYHHFKSGACETCDQPSATVSSEPRNCVLVNMEEQHLDSDQVLEFAEYNGRTRQLAGDAVLSRQLMKQSGLLAWLNYSSIPDQQERGKKSYYHYVNTSPNFRAGRKSHCLQHYQLRLMIFNNKLSPEVQSSCRLSKFLSSGDEINISLFYELDPISTDSPNERRKLNVDDRIEAVDANSKDIHKGIQLNPIIRDMFHSALVTFERQPRLFVGAQLDNVNVVDLERCYRDANATSELSLVLDIAFMSHTNERVRHTFSSVLCGQLGAKMGDGIELELCEETHLESVSQQMDKHLEQIKMQRLDETWKVSLLNNVFSLFIQWEPF